MARRDEENDILPVPNGWFAVAWSSKLSAGDVKPIHYFGQDLVLFRTRSGNPRVLDAYCPHLGAHLGHGGRVIGENVRCPFHGWSFDGENGECTKIDYCDSIPPSAHTRAWPVQEKNGMIFVWHHVNGNEPEWDFPELTEINDPTWVIGRTIEVEMDCPVQDAHENNNDPEHFFYVHGTAESPSNQLEIADDGRYYKMTSVVRGITDAGNKWELDLTRDSWGLGLNAVRLSSFGKSNLLLFASTAPINRERCLSRWLMTCTADIVDTTGEMFMSYLETGVREDQPIWKNKVHRSNPVLCANDHTLAEFRRWSRQFYLDSRTSA